LSWLSDFFSPRGKTVCKLNCDRNDCNSFLIYNCSHTHTHSHTRARARAHTHTHIYIYYLLSIQVLLSSWQWSLNKPKVLFFFLYQRFIHEMCTGVNACAIRLSAGNGVFVFDWIRSKGINKKKMSRMVSTTTVPDR